MGEDEPKAVPREADDILLPYARDVRWQIDPRVVQRSLAYLAVAAIGLFSYFTFDGTTRKGYCARCGMHREQSTAYFWFIPIPVSDKTTATELSAWIAAHDASRCDHAQSRYAEQGWYRSRCTMSNVPFVDAVIDAPGLRVTLDARSDAPALLAKLRRALGKPGDHDAQQILFELMEAMVTSAPSAKVGDR